MRLRGLRRKLEIQSEAQGRKQQHIVVEIVLRTFPTHAHSKLKILKTEILQTKFFDPLISIMQLFKRLGSTWADGALSYPLLEASY